MSYQQGSQQQTLKAFVPSYQVHSDFLPTHVNEGQNTQTAELVHDV